jgi:hypothetical protein
MFESLSQTEPNPDFGFVQNSNRVMNEKTGQWYRLVPMIQCSYEHSNDGTTRVRCDRWSGESGESYCPKHAQLRREQLQARLLIEDQKSLVRNLIVDADDLI